MHPPRLTRSHAYCALDLTVIICTCAPISKAPKCKTLSVSAMVVDLSNHCKWSEEFDTFSAYNVCAFCNTNNKSKWFYFFLFQQREESCYLRQYVNNLHEFKLHTYTCSHMHLLSLFCLFYCFLSMHGFLCKHVISKATVKSASGSNLIINTGEYTSIHIDIEHTICNVLKSIVKCSSSWSLKTKRAKPSSSKQSQQNGYTNTTFWNNFKYSSLLRAMKCFSREMHHADIKEMKTHLQDKIDFCPARIMRKQKENDRLGKSFS